MLLDGFFKLPPELMTALGTVLGFAFLDDLTADQQNSLGNFLILIGQILETSSTQKQLLEDLASAKQLEQMQSAIAELQAEVARIKAGDATPGPPPGRR